MTIPNRREFLAVSGAGLLSLASPRLARARFDETWLTYAPDVEVFWKPLPLLDRLRKLAEAGFTRYEFGTWKTKDIEAIARLNEELGIQPSLFLAYRGFADPKRKDAFQEAVELSVEVAQRLGPTKLTVSAGDLIDGKERDEQVDAAIDALKAASEKVAEAEVTLILDPYDAPRKKPLFAKFEEAAEVIKEVDSKLVRLLLDAGRYSDPDLAALIEKHKEAIGLYRIDAAAKDLPKLLKRIHDSGVTDPLGLGLAPKADPLAEIAVLRKADATAKSL